MSYTFDATSGATRDQLVDLVIANSFSASRYTEFVYGWLNDAVTDVCRKLRLHQGVEILDYDSAGVVTQPTQPFFHVDELWLASSDATGSGEQAFAEMTEPTRESFMEALMGIEGYAAPFMLEGSTIDTTVDGNPAVSDVSVQKYNGKGYAPAETFGGE